MPFGKVTNVLLLKNKNQAFLEFAEIQPAVTMVNFYNSDSVQPTLGGRTVFIQHSQHKVQFGFFLGGGGRGMLKHALETHLHIAARDPTAGK